MKKTISFILILLSFNLHASLQRDFFCEVLPEQSKEFRIEFEIMNLAVDNRFTVTVYNKNNKVSYCNYDVTWADYSPHSKVPGYIFKLKKGAECRETKMLQYQDEGFLKLTNVSNEEGQSGSALTLIGFGTLNCKKVNLSETKLQKNIKEKFN